MKMWETAKNVKTSLNGLYDWKIGSGLNSIMKNNKAIMDPKLQDGYGIDLDEIMNQNRPSIFLGEDKFVRPLLGFKTLEEYCHFVSGSHRIPHISVPTFFLNSLDDPIIGTSSIDYECFKHNPNV